ncbi:hypothetical protein A2U01_0077879, partial [Trifolium medium]|nr:hypothetical protein [Trifolium medium]
MSYCSVHDWPSYVAVASGPRAMDRRPSLPFLFGAWCRHY